jgi:hypothetical protein
MQIQSVIPQQSGLSTTIWAINENGEYIDYSYSHNNELIRDPKNKTEWVAWNGGSLTDAILYVINLKG